VGAVIEQATTAATAKANLDVFSLTLQQLAEHDKNIIVVTSD
jgi:hypothetical protein